MTISVNIHHPSVMEAESANFSNWIDIKTDDDEVTLFAPRHVCEATAAAFNRAMQVTQKGDALYYANDAGLWLISNDYGWRAQHDEITGDGDPEWMFAEAGSLEALQDALDDIAAERAEDVA